MQMVTRKSGLARKLLAVCLVFSLPIVVMFVLMTRAKLGEIEFASKELAGDAYRRPLEEALEHISRHRRPWTRVRGGDGSLTAQLRAEDREVAEALARVEAADHVTSFPERMMCEASLAHVMVRPIAQSLSPVA